MIINLEPVFNNDKSRITFDYNFSLDKADFLHCNYVLDTVHVFGEVRNNTGIVCLDAAAEYVFSASCDLCAKEFERTGSCKVFHYLVPHLNDEDNDLYIIVEDVILNLDELVREDIFLLFPSRLLCREDCRGLCHICGCDLNEIKCECKKAVDPRLSALADLLE